jgi:hypothetical protein
LASVHIFQRHPELRVVKKQLGYLDGLLPPKPLAAFAKKTTERKIKKVERVSEQKALRKIAEIMEKEKIIADLMEATMNLADDIEV